MAHSRQCTLKDTVVPLGCGRSSKPPQRIRPPQFMTFNEAMKQWETNLDIGLLATSCNTWKLIPLSLPKDENRGTGNRALNSRLAYSDLVAPCDQVHVGQKKLTDCATLQLCWSPYLKAVTSWTYWYCIIFVYSYIFLCFFGVCFFATKRVVITWHVIRVHKNHDRSATPFDRVLGLWF